jgi:hypothetical protein
MAETRAYGVTSDSPLPAAMPWSQSSQQDLATSYPRYPPLAMGGGTTTQKTTATEFVDCTARLDARGPSA